MRSTSRRRSNEKRFAARTDHDLIYAVGAFDSRQLGISGQDLPGSYAAADFVGWYNGHPDHSHHRFDLSGEGAVIVGNGKVALDVARVLLGPSMPPNEAAVRRSNGLG